MIGSTIFLNHLQITAPNGPFQFAICQATKTDIPELLQSKFVAVPVKKWYEMVPKVSRSVHGNSWPFASNSTSL